MAKLTMENISDHFRKLDVCMMTTRNQHNMLESCPMSNNKDVDYSGDSYFFTMSNMGVVSDLKLHPEVCLVYEGRSQMLTQHLNICVSCAAELI